MTFKQVEFLDLNGKTFRIGDKVLYIPNHANNDSSHKDCERGVITSMRDDGGIWVRYEKQHPTAPGQRTPVNNLRFE